MGKLSHLKDVFYNKYYLPTTINRFRAKKRNKNNNFSLICGNCMGGYIYHQLGVKFFSPTINLMILQPDLFKMVKDLKNYEKGFVDKTKGIIPVGEINGVKVNFTHYKSFDDAITKWEERFLRINWDNVYLIMTDRDGLTKEQIYELKNLNYKKILVFTANKYDLPYCFQIKKYEKEKCVGNILKKTLSGKWEFEKYFDWVAWLNSEETNVEKFRIKQ